MPKNGHDLSRIYGNALITGASSGIGRALAEVLTGQGITVTGTSRFPDARNHAEAVRWIHFDGSTIDGINKFCEANHDLLSSIDLFINNAGSAFFGKESQIPEEVLAKEHCLLYESPRQLSEHVLPHMRGRRRGAIINISSLAALFTLPYMEQYSRSKAELSRYTQQLISRTKGSGVTIIDFQPGDYRTNFNRNMVRYGEPDPLEERVWQQMEKNLNRSPMPERAARDLLRALAKGKSGTVRSGSFFQAKVAPLGKWLLPESMITRATRKYYRLP